MWMVFSGACPDLYATASRFGERTIEFNLLKGEVESNRRMYDAMLQQLKQSSIASAMRASTVRVVDPAEKPGRPYKPNRERAAILGASPDAFCGSALSCCGNTRTGPFATPVKWPPGLEFPSWG
jgi:uncharacterized protein involved in exopolysaccharide biosynthesis